MDSLFDDLEEVDHGSQAAESAARWRGEVPAARFLSWPPAMQFIYCAERDEESAADADCDPGWKQFYLDRAETYWQMAREAK